MALDAAALALCAKELSAALADARIDKIFEPTRDEVVLNLRTRTDNPRLFLSARSGSARACLTKETFENPQTPPSFCMLLRKHFTGGRLLEVRTLPDERILFFDFQCTNEMGDIVVNTMAAELMGRYSNLVLVQTKNPANPAAHYATTGPEIWEDADGAVDALVAGVGTGGTITGAGRYLREKNPELLVVAVEPADSPLLSEGRAGAHRIEGIGAGFVPQTLDRSLLDEVVPERFREYVEYGWEGEVDTIAVDGDVTLERGAEAVDLSGYSKLYPLQSYGDNRHTFYRTDDDTLYVEQGDRVLFRLSLRDMLAGQLEDMPYSPHGTISVDSLRNGADRLLEYRRDSVRLIFSRIVLERQGDGGLRILDLDMDYYLIR